MVQASHAGRRAKCVAFSNAILQNMKDDNFLPQLIFGDQATFHMHIFHMSGKLTVTMSEYGDSKIHKRI